MLNLPTKINEKNCVGFEFRKFTDMLGMLFNHLQVAFNQSIDVKVE